MPFSPGEISNSDSNPGGGLGYQSALGHGGQQPRSDHLPISDNNVTTTNDALDVGDCWDMPETESDIDVSFMFIRLFLYLGMNRTSDRILDFCQL